MIILCLCFLVLFYKDHIDNNNIIHIPTYIIIIIHYRSVVYTQVVVRCRRLIIIGEQRYIGSEWVVYRRSSRSIVEDTGNTMHFKMLRRDSHNFL